MQHYSRHCGTRWIDSRWFASGFTNSLNQRARIKASLITHTLARQEELFKGFIVAASRYYGEATVTSTPQVQELVELHGMISGMRVMSSSHTGVRGKRHG